MASSGVVETHLCYLLRASIKRQRTGERERLRNMNVPMICRGFLARESEGWSGMHEIYRSQGEGDAAARGGGGATGAGTLSACILPSRICGLSATVRRGSDEFRLSGRAGAVEQPRRDSEGKEMKNELRRMDASWGLVMAQSNPGSCLAAAVSTRVLYFLTWSTLR